MDSAILQSHSSSNRRVVVQAFTVPLSLRFLNGQPAFWQKQGYEVHILTSQDKYLADWIAQNQLIYSPIPFQRSVSTLGLNELRCLFLLIRYFLKIKPLTVHGNTPKAAFLSLLAAWLTRVPVRVYEMHGLPLETAVGWRHVGWRLLEKITCALATQTIAVSESLLNVAVENRLVRADKILTIHHGSCNGVDTENDFNPEKIDLKELPKIRQKWNLSVHHQVVGFVGRLTEQKGIIELQEAWQTIKLNYPDARLLVVGDSDSRVPLPQNLMKKLKQDPTILLVGHVENIANYYALMDFLVLPSHREGFGNVVIEAAAMGKAAVVSWVTGLKNAVLENKTGLFCEPKNVENLTEQILFYLDNPKIARLHGQIAQARAKHDFYPETIWQAKLRLYESLIARARGVYLPDVSPLLQIAN